MHNTSAYIIKWCIEHNIDTLVVEGDEHFICKDFTMPSADKQYLDKIMSFIKRINANKAS